MEYHFSMIIDTLYSYTFANDRVKYFKLMWKLKPYGENKTDVRMYYTAHSRTYSNLIHAALRHLYIYTFESLIEEIENGLESQ